MDNDKNLHDLIFKPIVNNIGDNSHILNNPTYINNINKRLASHSHEFNCILLDIIYQCEYLTINELVNNGVVFGDQFKYVLQPFGEILLEPVVCATSTTIEYEDMYNFLVDILNIYKVPVTLKIICEFIEHYNLTYTFYFKYHTYFAACLNLLIDNALNNNIDISGTYRNSSIYQYMFKYIEDKDILYDLTKKVLDIVPIEKSIISRLEKLRPHATIEIALQVNRARVDAFHYMTLNQQVVARGLGPLGDPGPIGLDIYGVPIYDNNTNLKMFIAVYTEDVKQQFLNLFKYYRKPRTLQQLCLLNAIACSYHITGLPLFINGVLSEGTDVDNHEYNNHKIPKSIIENLKTYSLLLDIKKILNYKILMYDHINGII